MPGVAMLVTPGMSLREVGQDNWLCLRPAWARERDLAFNNINKNYYNKDQHAWP